MSEKKFHIEIRDFQNIPVKSLEVSEDEMWILHNWETIILICLIIIPLLACVSCCLYLRLFREKKEKNCYRTKFLEKMADSTHNSANSAFVMYQRTKNEERLYEDNWFVNPTILNISFDNILGKGAFATIYKGYIKGESPLYQIHKCISTQRFQDCDSAVKVATTYGVDEVDQLNREIEVLKRIGHHTNIIGFLGWSLHNTTPVLLFELAQSNLLQYVRNLKENENPLPIKYFLSVLWQVSSGMIKIASLNMVHRDLAARNILLVEDYRPKIGDFGLCCDCDESFTYTASINKKLPMKWMSIEALVERTFSEKSDVWSFGILMYEMFTKGNVPYAMLNNQEMLKHLISGERLEKPEAAPEEIYEIMSSCWKHDPNDRPTFKELNERFHAILERETENYGYLSYPNAEKIPVEINDVAELPV